MSGHYEPELGQFAFGQPSQTFKVLPILEAAIDYIAHEIDRVVGNLRQTGCSPMSNSGDAFRCQTFGAWAYSWGDDPQPYNFRHPASDITVSWYKYAGRGMSCNRKITPDEVSAMMEDCLDALISVEQGHASFAYGGLGEVSYYEELGA